MQFIYQPLTWAFLLVLVPVLIHLINLVRQQRVKWAAMEFLLESHKKHRRWIWLKQLILLLIRMLAVAAVVAMLAGLVTQDQWSILGGQATHHFIVVDDSMSMSDRSNEGRALDAAGQALRRIAEQLAQQPTPQMVTLLRYSQASRQGQAADLNAALVDADFVEVMEEQRRQLDVTELAIEAAPALEIVERLLREVPERRRVVYVLSDFRTTEWDQSSELRESLRDLRRQDAEIHFIRCAAGQHQNVALTELAPEPGTLAAGVPFLVNVKVKNFGPTAAQQVPIRIGARSFPEGVFVASGDQTPEEQVTTLLIDEVPAGEVASRQAQLKFVRAGQHVVEASLTADAVAADNRRLCLIDLPPAIPVLLIDGSGQEEEAFFLKAVFSPGRVVTGIQAVSRSASYLRDVADAEIDKYAAIYLLNVDQLEPRAISALDRYLRKGGGVAVFPGPLSDPRFLNELYDDGSGWFPLRVGAVKETFRTGADQPDLQVNDHPIFRALVDEGGKNRPLTRQIRIDRYLTTDPQWTSAEHPGTEVLAAVRGEDPLVISRRIGAGQVVAFLTTASPTWNNWARGPTYPVVLLQLHAFLSAPRHAVSTNVTGQPIQLQLDVARFRPEIAFHLPGLAAGSGGAPALIKKEPDTAPDDSPLLTFSLGMGAGSTRTGETDRSGVYVAQAETLEGQPEQRRLVVNVPVDEGDLAMLESQELTEQLEDIKVVVHDAQEMDYEAAGQDGFAWSQLLAMMLVVLFVGEQLFAYSASYHPRQGGQR